MSRYFSASSSPRWMPPKDAEAVSFVKMRSIWTKLLPLLPVGASLTVHGERAPEMDCNNTGIRMAGPPVWDVSKLNWLSWMTERMLVSARMLGPRSTNPDMKDCIASMCRPLNKKPFNGIFFFVRRQSGCHSRHLNCCHRRGMLEAQAHQARPTSHHAPPPPYQDGVLLCCTCLCIASTTTAAAVGQSGSSFCMPNLPEEHEAKPTLSLLFPFTDRLPDGQLNLVCWS